MSLSLEQIENHMGRSKAGRRKWRKNQRNRKIRRAMRAGKDVTVKYKGWEY